MILFGTSPDYKIDSFRVEFYYRYIFSTIKYSTTNHTIKHDQAQQNTTKQDKLRCDTMQYDEVRQNMDK